MLFRSILDGQSAETAYISRQYLNRVRWLGAYRRLLIFGTVAPAIEAWPLPDGRTSWLLATAHKYRGALLAQLGRTTGAENDFQRSMAVLRSETTPLMRFIAGTSALQAGDSLREMSPDHARGYYSEAREVFAALTEFQNGPARGSVWLARVEGLVKGASGQNLSNPQFIFSY